MYVRQFVFKYNLRGNENMKKLAETGIADEIFKTLTEKDAYAWEASFSEDAVKMLFEGVATYLGEVKSKKEIKAAVLNDLKGNFHFAAFVQFIPNEEDKEKGSYSLNFTFDESDITKEMKVVTFKDPTLHHIISDVGVTKFNICFHSYEGQEFIVPVMAACADAIKEHLRANISIDPKLEMEDFFTATAEMDGDKVYCSITPSAVLKQHVKDDASIETPAA